MGIRLRGWGMAVPDRVVTNDELSQTLDTSDEWIFERTGIRERRMGGTAVTLGTEAARRALADADVDAASIDFLMLATTTPDQLMPASSTRIAQQLGITAPALDVNAACSGFMYALRCADGLAATGAHRVLIIGAEHLSRWNDATDRTMAVLFGDGAGAVVVDAVSDTDLLGFDLGSDGNHADLLYCDHGGYIWMDGKEIFRRAVRIMVESSERALEQAKVSVDELALVIPHQANVRIIQAACSRLGIEMERSVVVLDRYGNTSSASIPIAVMEARAQDRLRPGDLVLMTGFGAGMTWASAVVRWNP
jgi:3-oxoacyl-[acyl-carrier-protein] synthase III